MLHFHDYRILQLAEAARPESRAEKLGAVFGILLALVFVVVIVWLARGKSAKAKKSQKKPPTTRSRRSADDSVPIATIVTQRSYGREDSDEAASNSTLLWILLGSAVALMVLVGAVVALVIVFNGWGRSSSDAILSLGSGDQFGSQSGSQDFSEPVEQLAPLDVPAPVLKDNRMEIALSEPFSQVQVGGGGRFFIFHLKNAGKLAVLDVSEAKLVKEIDVPGDVIYACGRKKLFVVYPDQKRIEPWSLLTWEREPAVSVPDGRKVLKAIIGSYSPGPLLLWTGGDVLLLDGERLERIMPVGEVLSGGTGYELRVSADGQTFVGWTSKQLNPRYSVMRLNGRRSKVLNTVEEVSRMEHWAMPSADGRLLLRDSTRASSQDLQPMTTSGFRDTTFMPTQDPRFILGLHAQDNQHDQVEICTTSDVRSVFTFKDIEKFPPGSTGTHYGLWGEREPRVQYIPSAKLLVSLPPSDDRIVLRFFDLQAALEK
jgi:flagellar basal body-associated protein FliL